MSAPKQFRQVVIRQVYRHEDCGLVDCHVCDGVGTWNVRPDQPCYRCNGAGKVSGGTRRVEDHRERATVDVEIDIDDLIYDIAWRAAANRTGRSTSYCRKARVVDRQRLEEEGNA